MRARVRQTVVVVCCALPAATFVGLLTYVVLRHQLLERCEVYPDITALEFSPDGERLFSGGWLDSLELWDSGKLERRFGLRKPYAVLRRSAEELRKLRAEGDKPGWISCLASSPDGERLFVAVAFGPMRLLDLRASPPCVLWENGRAKEHEVRWATFARRTNEIIVDTGHTATCLDEGTGRPTRSLAVDGRSVLSQDERFLMTVSKSTLDRVALATGARTTCPVEPGPYGGEPISFALTADETRALICHFSAIRLHDARTGETIRSFETKTYFPRAYWSPQGDLAVVIEQGDPMGMDPSPLERAELLDTATGTTRPFPLSVTHGEKAVSAAFSPDGTTVAIATSGGRIVLLSKPELAAAK